MTSDEQEPRDDAALERRGVEVRNRLAARVDLLERRGQNALHTVGRLAHGAKVLWPVTVVALATIGVGVWMYRRKRPRSSATATRRSPALHAAGVVAGGVLRNLSLAVARHLAQRAFAAWAGAPEVGLDAHRRPAPAVASGRPD
jgi:hypothetical protein